MVHVKDLRDFFCSYRAPIQQACQQKAIELNVAPHARSPSEIIDTGKTFSINIILHFKQKFMLELKLEFTYDEPVGFWSEPDGFEKLSLHKLIGKVSLGHKMKSPRDVGVYLQHVREYLARFSPEEQDKATVREISWSIAVEMEVPVYHHMKVLECYSDFDMEDYQIFYTASGKIDLFEEKIFIQPAAVPTKVRTFKDAESGNWLEEWSMDPPNEVSRSDIMVLGVWFTVADMQAEYGRDVFAAELNHGVFWEDFFQRVVRRFNQMPEREDSTAEQSDLMKRIKALLEEDVKTKVIQFLAHSS